MYEENSNVVILGIDDEIPEDNYSNTTTCVGIDINNPFDEYLVLKSDTSDKIIYKLINKPDVSFSYNSDSDLESDSNSDSDSDLESESNSDNSHESLEELYINQKIENINLENQEIDKKSESEICEILNNNEIIKLLSNQDEKIIIFFVNDNKFEIKIEEIDNYLKLFDLLNNQKILFLKDGIEYTYSNINEWSKKIE